MSIHWYAKEKTEVLKILGTTEMGLTTKEAEKRLEEHGPNVLPEPKIESLWSIFVSQFKSPLISILIGAACVLLYMKEFVDAGVVFFVLIFNAVVGTIQEGKARNIFLALRRMVETKSLVVRDNQEVVVSSRHIVPGDIIILEAGDKVPADARLIISYELKTDESAFTGESIPVVKADYRLKETGVNVADQLNMVFKGTHVVNGRAKAVVVETGPKTEIGKISQAISRVDTEVPLKKEIKKITRFIILAVAVVGISLFVAGLMRNESPLKMFSTVVALVISIIPEGLPIVLTLVLATGVWRMGKKNALVKKLQAVEALGQADVIAIDKTGTITKNKMMVKKIFTGNLTFEITGSEYEPKGEIKLDGKKVQPQKYLSLVLSAQAASLTAKAKIYFLEKERKWKVSGDPTEAAMIAFAGKAGIERERLLDEYPVVSEKPFDHKDKFRATFHKKEKGWLGIYSGAPESILKLTSRFVDINGKELDLNRNEANNLERIFSQFSREGLRVVAFAFKESKDLKKVQCPESLTFLSFMAIRDVLRPEVYGAIERAKQAGIRVVMITGDHKLTAHAIAKEAGILLPGNSVVTGDELEEMTDWELADKIDSIAVFARVTPEQKLKIISAYKQSGRTIAMTGDGVNDAPSLVAADLGVAMGKIGTEVAKEASDIVLLDDNLQTIISAVEEGRSIYRTIKKVILYLFSTSLGEILTISGAILLGYPLPLLPTQIIWLNLITDGFLDVSLAMEPKDQDLLSKESLRKNRSMIDKTMIVRMIVMSLPMMIGTLILFGLYLQYEPQKSLTISLTLLAAFQWLNAWNCRQEKKSIFLTNPFSNKYLLAATFLVILLHVFIVYSPFGNAIFYTTPLEISDWIVVFGVALLIVVAEETRKLLTSTLRRSSATS